MAFGFPLLQLLPHAAYSFAPMHTQLHASLLNVAIAIVALLVFFSLTKWAFGSKSRPPPAVPGLPILGNLLQLTATPYKTFTAWAEKYGPIFKIKTGVVTMVVISSAEIAKEAMATKYSSISSKQLPKTMMILSRQKTMVLMLDYGEEYRMLKKLVVTNLLAASPQKAFRGIWEKASYEMLDDMFKELKKYPGSTGILNIRDHVKKALFSFTMYQVLGRDPESIAVAKMGRIVSRLEMFDILVMDPLKACMNVDWREFFPALKWIPNRTVEDVVNAVERRRTAVVRSLIDEQRALLADGKEPNCYLDILLTQATLLTPTQLEMSVFEAIIGGTDTTMVTIEWALYEIARDPAVQAKLYKEIDELCGSRIVREDDLPKLKYLDAIVKETLRRHAPVPLLPPRYVEKDVQLGGYDLKQGDQIIINVYGINYNKKVWDNPEVWDPQRVDEKLDLGFNDHRVLSFGMGKRMCPGVTQVMYIIPMALAFFVHHFEWALPPHETLPHAQSVMYTFLTAHKLQPLECIATPRCLSRLLPSSSS